EELKMYEDSPDDLSYDLLVENIYANDGLGMNIIGTKESLYNITRESMLEYLNKYYIPNNAVISIAGNFDLIFSTISSKLKFPAI
ncbi:insulinase family protein, partial [Clostridioides difficile]|uniref:insulinase family protein n=1 Tax=Clostridioides difficile TaxID=1496 RepID=UPI0018DE6D14